MPNPPKPIERKRALGNPGKRRLPDRNTVTLLPGAEEPPEPPRPLGHIGRQVWDRVWEHGRTWVSAGTDLDLVLLLCESMDERAILRVRVLREGEWRDRVALRHLDHQIAMMLGQLAFTPTDRSRLGVAEVTRVSKLEALRAAKRGG